MAYLTQIRRVPLHSLAFPSLPSHLTTPFSPLSLANRCWKRFTRRICLTVSHHRSIPMLALLAKSIDTRSKAIGGRRWPGKWEDWYLERKFKSIPGVVDVTGFGGPTKVYQVELDPNKLRALGLTQSQSQRQYLLPTDQLVAVTFCATGKIIWCGD